MLIIGVGRVGALAVRKLAENFPEQKYATCTVDEDASGEQSPIVVLDPDGIDPAGLALHPGKATLATAEYLREVLPGSPVAILLCHDLTVPETRLVASLAKGLGAGAFFGPLRVGPEDGYDTYTTGHFTFNSRRDSDTAPLPYVSVGIRPRLRKLLDNDIEKIAGLYADVGRFIVHFLGEHHDVFADGTIEAMDRLKGLGIVVTALGEDEAKAAAVIRDGLRHVHVKYVFQRADRVYLMSEASRLLDSRRTSQLYDEVSQLIPQGSTIHPHHFTRGDASPAVRVAVFALRHKIQAVSRTDEQPVSPQPDGTGGEPAPAHPTPPDPGSGYPKPGDKPEGLNVN